MDSGMISKIEKAKRYAEERNRVTFKSLAVEFRGEHSNYEVTYCESGWSCQCDFFQRRGVCSHTMAMERILEPMIAMPEIAEDKEQA
ncbi:MAG: hypothetical protein GXY52_06420 [Chloroflexi bacterium]|nr:hypothetical protein [Chloroflexota bacterium]